MAVNYAELPVEVALYYDYLTTNRIFKPAVCQKHQIRAFSWSPLLAFVYGEHAVLSGHKALLFKPNAFVAVALVIERNVPDFMVRLRAYTRPDALNRFINDRIDDFDPVLEHEEADLAKFELIEKIIEGYLRKNIHRVKDYARDALLGTAMLHHISYFRPGSGLNWSGSSAIAISSAIHRFYFGTCPPDDVIRLSLPIELIYQGGRASGYGFAVLSPNSIMTYTLTDTGLDKLNKLQNIKTDIEEVIHGNRSVQSKLVECVLSDDLAAFKAERDFLVRAPASALDRSIAKMLDPTQGELDHFVPLCIDSGVPKSTDMVLEELVKRRIDDTWHSQIADVWKGREQSPITTPAAFIEFTEEISHALKEFKDKDGAAISTGLWIPAYETIIDKLMAINRRCFKFTGSGHGGSLLAFIDGAALETANQILTRLARYEKSGEPKCRYFCNGLTNAEPKSTDGVSGGNPTKARVLIITLTSVSVLAIVGVYLPVSYHLNAMWEGKADAGIYWLLWPSAIALAVVLLPWLYKMYQVGCRTTPPHMRTNLEKVMLRKRWVAKTVGHLLDVAEKPGGGQLLIWLFLVCWSNLVFLAFLLLEVVLVFKGHD